MKSSIFAATVIVGAVLFATFKYSRSGYESPDYRVQLEDGSFEIREYPSMTLVSTPMAKLGTGEDESFMRLFRYISGTNEAEKKIAMTTPVLMTGRDGGGQMSFIAPRDVAAAGAPQARDRQVRLETMNGGRFAAFRFNGRLKNARFDEAEQKLLAWIEQRGLTTVGEPISAGYDPPFTPPFLRRNEVLIRLAE